MEIALQTRYSIWGYDLLILRQILVMERLSDFV